MGGYPVSCRLLSWNIPLVLIFLLITLPARALPATAATGLTLSWKDGGKALIDAHFEHVHIATDGTITASVVLHPKFHIFYNLSLTAKAAVDYSWLKKLM